MPSPLAIVQFARIVGREDLLTCLGLPTDAPLPERLSDEQVSRARGLADERVPRIAEALLAEATALDDIQDAAGAMAYLEERLAFFAPLLTDAARAAVTEHCRAVADHWRSRS